MPLSSLGKPSSCRLDIVPLAGLASLQSASTTETSATGTRKTCRSFAVQAGMTLAHRFRRTRRRRDNVLVSPAPPRQSFLEGPSTVFCVRGHGMAGGHQPFTIPQLSFKTFATGARQFVVQEAFEIIFISVYSSFRLRHDKHRSILCSAPK